MNGEIVTSLNTLRERPGDPQALQSLEDLLSRTPSLPSEEWAALQASLQHHRERGNWEVVIRLIDLQLPHLSDPAARAELLRTKGHVLEDELLEEPAAIAAFEQALALRPDDERIQEALEQIQLIRENWEAVAGKYVEEAEAAADRQLATSLLLSAAEVVWRNEPSSAKAEQYLRRSLEVEPRNRKASAHLERLLRRAGRLREVAELLEQRADVAGSREERLAALLVCGDLWAVELGDPEAAAARYRRALSLDPTDPWALRCLVNALTAQESWAALVRVYEDALRARPAADQEQVLLLQIAGLLDTRLHQPDQAEEYFRRVRKTSPAHPAVLEFYRRYYRDRGEPTKILALLDGAARMEGEAGRRLELWQEMARVAEEEVGNLEKAIDIWKGLQRLAPTSPEPIAALRRLYRSTQPPKWNALRELLKDEIDRLSDDRADEKIRLLLEIVEIYRDHLRLDVMVINTYNAILALRSDHAEALDALAKKFESMNRWNDLIAHLLRWREVQTDPARKVETLHRVASLWIEKFGNQSQAIKPLSEILELDPVEQRALQALRDIHTRRRNWRELMELCRAEASHREPDRRRALYKEMAWLAAEKLGDAREGIQVWNQVLEEDPQDREALAELATLYRKEERWAALAEVLHRQAEAARERPEEALPLLEGLGDIYGNRLRAVENAIEVWREVLAIRPDAPKARAVLRELYVQEQRWEDLDELFRGRAEHSDLAETLSAAADRSPDRVLKVQLYLKVGRICWEQLKNTDRATKAYERVMAIDGTHLEAARALVPLYRGAEKWTRLLATYEILLRNAATNEEKLGLLEEIRTLCERQLGSKTLAFQWCAQAFALEPGSPELRGELERLAADAEAWEDLVHIYAARVEQLPVGDDKIAMLRHLAELCSDRLHRPEEAEVHYRRLLELQPEGQGATEALEELEAIYVATQRWAPLAEVYRRRTQLETEPETKVELLFKIAFLHEERLGDPEGATRTFDEIINLDPENLRALRSLERLYLVGTRWEPLTEILRRQLDLLPGKEERVDALHRLGEIHRSRLGRSGEALGFYARALEADPVHRPTVQALETYLDAEGPEQAKVARLLQPFYERTEDWAKLARALDLLLAAEDDRDGRIGLYRRLMGIHARRLDDQAAAFAAGSNIMALDPEDAEVRREMWGLAERLNRVDELAGLIADSLHRLPAGAQLTEKALSWDLAVLLDERLGRPEEAERYLRRVVELDSSHQEAFDKLERVLRDAGKWPELRDILEQRKQLAQAPALRRDILLQISALNEDVLGDDAAAIRAYEEILGLEPDHGDSLRALERHYAAAGHFRDLLELLRREMDFAADDAALSGLKLRQAELLAHQLSEAVGAVDLLEEVVSLDPDLQPAVDLLEELKETAELRRRVTEILEPVYQRRESWGDLVRILLVRRALSEDRFEAVELLRRAAGIYESELRDRASAFTTLREALLLEPGTPEIQQAVERLGGELGAWTETAEAWQRAFEAADPADMSLRGNLLLRQARVLDEKVADPVRAREAFERLLALDASNLAVVRPAADALARLYEGALAWPELIGILRRQLEWTEGLEARQALRGHITRIQEEMLGDVDGAVATYHEILGEEPSAAMALDALERLHLQREQWPELVEVYRRRVNLAASKEERRSHWLRIAGIYEEEMRRPEEAMAAYLSLLDELPEDLEALRALARLYRNASRFLDLLEILERELRLSDAEARVPLLFEAATLQHQQLREPGLAVDRYREVLEREPGHAGAREALQSLLSDPDHRLSAAAILAPLYEKEGSWDRLIQVLELQAEPAETPRKVELLGRVAELAETAQNDPDRAFDAYRRAVQAAATDPRLLALTAALQRLAEARARQAELVDTLEQVLPDVMDPDARKAVHRLAAEVSRQNLHDLQRARRHYQEILDAEAENREALENLDQILLALSEWDPLLGILSRRIELCPDEQGRRDLHVRSAQIWRDQLHRPDEAIADFEQVLRIAPAERAALAALDDLYTSTERWTDLADLLERTLRASEDRDEQVGLHYRLGQLRSSKLDDPVAALREYQTVLSLDPAHGPVVAELEAYLDSTDHRVEAAGILEPIYSGRQDWERLIRIYQIRLEAAEDGEKRLALSTRIAQLCEEQLEDLEGAFLWYGKVFLEKPEDNSIRDQLLRLAGILDRWPDAAGIFAQYLERTLEENETTREVCLLLGNIYDERLSQVEPAAGCFRRALEANRDDEEAFQSLESLLTRWDRWQELLALYQEAAEAALDSRVRRELLLKICRVWEEALENLPEAIDAYRAVLDLDENDETAITHLDRLYTETARWQDLSDLLLRRSEVAATEDERVALIYRLGTTHELRLENLASAIDYYEDVLRRRPEHAGAIAALERLILDRDQRFRISQILEPRYRDQDEWAKLVVIYDAQLDFIDDKDRRNFLLREIARLHEEREGSLELAFRALCRAFQESPDQPELLAEVERMAGLTTAWPELVRVLNETSEGIYDFGLLARVQTRLARIQEEQTKDPMAAIDAWRRVLAAQEDNREAMDSLVRLYDQLGMHEALIEVLTRRAEASRELTDQKEDYYRIARLHHEVLKHSERAVDIYRQVLSLDEDDRTSLDALEQLYLSLGNWMELIWVYRRKIDLAEDAGQRRWLQLAVAEVYEEKLADRYEAIATYKALLDQSPGDTQVLDALDRLYTQEALHADLLEVVESKIRVESDRARRNALTHRAGTILEKEIGDLDQAIDRYRTVVEDDSAHAEARGALERLVRGPSHRELLVGILEALYQRTNEVKPLVEALELQLEVLSDPLARRDLLLRIARLQEEGLGEAQAAFAALARALAEDPAHPATQAELDRVAEKIGAIKELCAVYEERLEAIYEPSVAYGFHRKVAAFLEERLHDDARAAEHYRAAVESGGEELPALQALDRVLHRMGRSDELLEVIGRQITLVPAPSEQAQLFFRMGQIQAQRPDLDGAFASYREAVERDTSHLPAREALEGLLTSDNHRVAVLEVLEPLVETAGDLTKLVKLLEVRLKTLEAAPERTAVLERIARLHEDLGAPEQALGALGRALAEDAGSPSVQGGLERLAGKLGRFRELAALADEIMASAPSPEAARELGLRAALWHGEKLNDIQRSEATFKKVLEVDPDCGPALLGLERIFRATADSRQLADILWRRAELEQDGQQRCQLLTEVAGLRETALQDVSGAVAAWRAVLESDPARRDALGAMARLFEASRAWSDYLDTLERQAESADSREDQLGLKHRIAEVLLREVQSADRAIEVYREILDLDPSDGRSLGVLEQLHTERQDWRALQDVLERRLESVSGQDRITVLLRQAELSRKRLGQPEDAISSYQQVLAEDGEHAQALAELEATFRETSKWYDLIDILERHAKVLAGKGDSKGELELLVQAARVWSESLEQPDAAAEMLEQVLQRDPQNVIALAGLAQLYEGTQQWDRCREVLQQAAALNPEPRAAAELAFRMGKLELQASSDEAAAAAQYAKALELDPDHREAREALEAHSRKQKDWTRLAGLLGSRAERATTPDEQLPILRELGSLYLERLDQPGQAVQVLERARNLRPEDPEVLAPLADAYAAAGRSDEAAPILQRLVDVAGRRRGKDVAQYIQRLGAIAERKGDLAGAREHYDKAYRIDSTHGPTLVALGRIYVQTEDWQNARKIYRSMLLQNMDERSGIAKADILYNLGLAHLALGERSKAISMFERGLEVDSAHAGLKEALAKARS